MSHGLVAGIVLAALVHAYPELAGLTLLSVICLLGQRTIRQADLRSDLEGLGLAVVVAALLIAPAAPTLIRFVTGQATVAFAAADRPAAALFPSLFVLSRTLSALWALGGEHRATPLLAGK